MKDAQHATREMTATMAPKVEAPAILKATRGKALMPSQSGSFPVAPKVEAP